MGKEKPCNGRPGYFIGKGDMLQPRIPAKPPIFSMVPTWTNFDLARLISTLIQLKNIRKCGKNDGDG
jgi:hypothetical protein